MWEQNQHLLPISATIVVFSNMDTKVAWQKFLVPGPSGWKKKQKRDFFEKSRLFWLAWIFSITSRRRAMPEISAGPQNFWPQIFFCLPVKKSCYGFGRLRWTLTLRNLKILIFFEKFDIFENFENFRFWNFLKNFWILHPSKIHNMIWKISWYDVINMF